MKSTHDLNKIDTRSPLGQQTKHIPSNKSPTQVQLISTDLTSVNHLEGGE